jgi:hypothetical protein
LFGELRDAASGSEIRQTREADDWPKALAREAGMRHADHSFRIRADNIEVHTDLQRQCVLICCVTEDGKSVQLEADYQTLDRLHQEIQRQLEDLA